MKCKYDLAIVPLSWWLFPCLVFPWPAKCSPQQYNELSPEAHTSIYQVFMQWQEEPTTTCTLSKTSGTLKRGIQHLCVWGGEYRTFHLRVSVSKVNSEIQAFSMLQVGGWFLLIIKPLCDFILQKWSQDGAVYGKICEAPRTIPDWVKLGLLKGDYKANSVLLQQQFPIWTESGNSTRVHLEIWFINI